MGVEWYIQSKDPNKNEIKSMVKLYITDNRIWSPHMGTRTYKNECGKNMSFSESNGALYARYKKPKCNDKIKLVLKTLDKSLKKSKWKYTGQICRR